MSCPILSNNFISMNQAECKFSSAFISDSVPASVAASLISLLKYLNRVRRADKHLLATKYNVGIQPEAMKYLKKGKDLLTDTQWADFHSEGDWLR